MIPLVSVIVPIYNSRLYLKEAVDSILCQTLKQIEVILVDDGSTDGTIEILQNISLLDRRVKIVYQSHCGAGVARNKGLSVASGKYLSFLDSDDIFDKYMLEEMYAMSNSKDLDVLISPYRLLSDNQNVKRGLILPQGVEGLFNCYDLPDSFLQITSPNAWSKLFNREFILKYNLSFQDLSSCNDVFFSYASMVLAKNIAVLNKSFVSYRKGANGSISSSRGLNSVNIIHAGTALREILKEHELFDLLKQSFYKRMYSCFDYELNFVSLDELDNFNRSVVLFLNDA